MSQTLQEAKREFRRQNPNLRVNGWDLRDYKLWSDIRGLRSYGRIAPNDVMISLKETLALLDAAAEKRFEDEWKAREADSLARPKGKET